MKQFKRFMSLFFALTVIFASMTFVAADEASAEHLTNGNIEIYVSSDNGGFVIRTAEGDKLNKDDNNKDLLYRSADFDTSFTSIQITEEGKEPEEYIFGNDYSFLGLMGNGLSVTKDDTGINAVWTVNDITVTQRVEPIIDTASERHGLVKISYDVVNGRGKNVDVKVRLLLDTALGNQDYAYYSIARENTMVETVYSEMEYSDTDVPVYFESIDSNGAPSIFGYSVLEVDPEVKRPYKIIFAHWNNLASTIFDYTPDTTLAFVSEVNVGYKTADSAVALYYDLGTVAPQGTANASTFYGVRSRANFNSDESKIDFTLTAPAAMELSSDKSNYLDREGNPTGLFTVGTNLLNTGETYDEVVLAVYTDAGIVPVDDLGNDLPEKPTRENPAKTYLYDFGVGSQNAQTIDWQFRAEVDARASLRRIEFKAYIPEGEDRLLLEENVIGAATMYLLCPGGDGNVEKVFFTSISPDVVYFDGIRNLNLLGGGFDLLEAKAGYTLRAYLVSNRNVFYDIPLNNLTFKSTGEIEIALNKKMQVGTYELVFNCDEELQNAGIAQNLTSPVLMFNVSDDPIYRNDSYATLAVVINEAEREKDITYSVETYENENLYDKHGEDDLLLEFKGYFSKEEKKNGDIVYTSVLGGNKDSVVINEALVFQNGAISITEKKGENGSIKIEMDGELRTFVSDTPVSDGKITITELKNGELFELVNYDDFGERYDMSYSAQPIYLEWASEYIGYSMFDGFPIAINDAVFGKIHKRQSTDPDDEYGIFDGYTISFSGEMNLKFLVPGELPLGMGAQDVVFGRSEGFLGINAEGSVIIPSFAKPIGSLAGTLGVNTINDNYTVGVNGTVEFAHLFEAEFELVVKAGDDNTPIPDRLGLYFRDFKPGQPIGPPIFFLTGGGGGYDELYDTIYAKGAIPPLTLDAMVQISLLRLAKAEAQAKISLGGFALGMGPMELEALPITIGPAGEMAVNWYPDFSLYQQKSVQLVAPFIPPGMLRGSMQTGIGIVNDRFLAEMFVNAYIYLPTDFLLGVDIELAEAGMGISNERIWGIARVLGIGIGAAYYWGDGDLDLSLSDLDRYKPEFGSEFDVDENAKPELFNVNARNAQTPVLFSSKAEPVSGVMLLGTNVRAVSEPALSGESGITSSADGLTHNMTMGKDAAGGVLLTLKYDEEVTEQWVKSNVVITNNGNEAFGGFVFPTETAYGEGVVSEGNAYLSTGEGKSILTIGITPDMIKGGTWNIETGKKASVSMYAVEPLSEITGVSAEISENNLNVKWTGTKLSEAQVDFYVSASPETAGVYLGTASDTAALSETFTLPETLQSGTYYVYGICQNDDAFSRAVSESTFEYVNPNAPSDIQQVTLQNIGNEYFSVNITDGGTADGYTMTAYEVQNDGSLASTDYTNLLYNKGDEMVIGGRQTRNGNDFGMFGGKTYIVEVTPFKLHGESSIIGKAVRSAETLLNPSTPPVITFEANELYNTSDVSFTLTTNVPVTGYVSIDEAQDGDKYISVDSETKVDVNLTLNDGQHKVRFKGSDDDGDSFLYETTFIVDTEKPVLLLESPVNGGTFMEDGSLTIKGISEKGVTYSVLVDGQMIVQNQNLDSRIDENGVFTLEELNIGADKDVKTIEIIVKDKAGNETRESAKLRNAALGNLEGVVLSADGASVTGKNIDLSENADTTVTLALLGETNSGNLFSITDTRLVSMNVVTKSGSATIDENGVLTISSDAVGFVEGMLQVGENGLMTDSLSFGLTNEMSGVYTVIFIDNEIAITTAKTDKNGKLTSTQIPKPSKNGYSFNGWYLDAELTQKLTDETVFTSDTNLYAKWSVKQQGTNAGSIYTYSTITVNNVTEGGTITPRGTVRVQYGQSITFNIMPDEGYEIEDVIVNGKSVGAVETYRVEKVTKDLQISAKFKKIKTDEIKPGWNPFTDVKQTDWFYDDIKYAYENNLMLGVSENLFDPNGSVTRAMLVTVLYRNEGEPEIEGVSTFTDVESGSWYDKAVSWAQANGIVNGYSETQFAPNEPILREQIAAIMHRYAQYKGYDVSVGENTNILSYDDFDSISEYAIASMQYACGSGLIKGKSESTLNPLDNATRAEIATILHRFIVKNK